MTNQNPFTASFSDTADFEKLEDGMYPATICGIVARNFPDYNDKSVMVTKCQAILQVALDGQTYYFRTKPMKPIVNEKSNLMVFLNSATGATIEKIHEKYPQGFPLENLVGVPVQAVINTVTGKDGKEYANLANCLKASKKGVKTAVVQDAIPAYLVRGAVSYKLADCLTVKEETVKAATFQAAAAPSAAPMGAPGIVGAPAAANISQNPNPAAFMGAGLQVTNPDPGPAQTPSPAAQAMAAEGLDDPDGDLPF